MSISFTSLYWKSFLNGVISSSGTNADIMKVGGYKLSALEIEAVLLEVCFLLFFMVLKKMVD